MVDAVSRFKNKRFPISNTLFDHLSFITIGLQDSSLSGRDRIRHAHASLKSGCIPIRMQGDDLKQASTIRQPRFFYNTAMDEAAHKPMANR